MNDIIRLLPDSIANQIAAGEVIQQPASVVKELVENAIDAGADEITVIVKDAGKTLIQVIDNGKGMSETDARMAFERHATSKIKKAEDLFSLHTMGFRGEALASIAAVAQVELKTKQKERETGTLISISASQYEKQEDIATADGSIFSVKNLFFNLPVRRKFLKSPETEFRNILNEFECIVLINPTVSFHLFHDDTEIFNLPATNIRQRIANVFGKNINQQLLPIHVETSLIKIYGFIGTPASAKKRGAWQYFFVNGRYMEHAYFHKAVTQAFDPFIPTGDKPNYFIYLEIDPGNIDVNIHPTKKKIKFEHEQAIFPIILSVVKEGIGKSATTPTIEFDQEGAINLPAYQEKRAATAPVPQINYNPQYNPFRQTASYPQANRDWEKLFEKKENSNIPLPSFDEVTVDKQMTAPEEIPQPALFEFNHTNHHNYKGRFLITSLKSGLAIIDQRRAHIRILFDRYMQQLYNKKGISQGLLFPEIIAFTPQEATMLPYMLEEFAFIGFDLSNLGNNTYAINGVPAGLENIDIVEVLKDMLNKAIETGCEIREEICEALSLALAQQAAIPFGKMLSLEEADQLVADLFSSSSPNYTPNGKVIISLLNDDELEKRFK
ncbi:MAG: DNA mismatch repair endonuclease MutL [Dysgonamonadaceae bacterium]|jgi:DNA mismatch repair protein MutL|nr:DNA mismatch repair endonuclease MutL [Dysgonamonadaceae bacterium]